MEIIIKIDDLGVYTTIFGNTHIVYFLESFISYQVRIFSHSPRFRLCHVTETPVDNGLASQLAL